MQSGIGTDFFSGFITFLQILLWAIFFYYLVISTFGWFKRKEEPAENFPLINKFAIIISAYNEEKVIGNIVRNLKGLNYPKDMYDIFVVADNCTDKTFFVAKDNGAIAYERFDADNRGKGHCLEWMFKKLFELEKQYDAIAIFDADNLASPNFLLEMNKQLCNGHKVIQGYLDSKNPYDSWISGNYSIAYWISNRLFQLPRYYLGLSCALGGTGFVMRTDILRQIGWGATCLTEDLEFSLKLVLRGMKISWSHEAIVYDEKPLLLSQSWRQRNRWMQGHCDCAGRYFKPLFLKGIRDRDPVALDSALYLLQPFVIVANGIGMVLGLIGVLINLNDFININSISFGALILVLTYVNIVFVFAEGKLTKKIAKYFLVFPVYSLTWVPIIIQGFYNRNKKEWAHTLHTRALEIKDIKQLEKVKVG